MTTVLAFLLLSAGALCWLLMLELAMLGTFELAAIHARRIVTHASAAFVRLEWWRWWRRREVWIVVLLSLSVSPAAGCALSDEARARTALNAIAVPVDTAWGLAEDVCLARQAPLAEKQKAGLATPEETAAALLKVRASCQPATDVFDAIKAAHDQATAALRNGDLARAKQLLDQILAQFRAYQAKRSSP
jgi:hypothetical protein